MKNDWKDIDPELASEAEQVIDEMDGVPLWVDDSDNIIEPVFADCFLKLHPMKCYHGRLFTVDGMMQDESPLEKTIYEMIRPYIFRNVARKVKALVQIIKVACQSEPPPLQSDRIHVANGTYYLDGHFTEEKEFCLNRLPVSYNPEDHPPECWLGFLSDLLYEEDIPTLQEYMGYCLIPVTKAQKMMTILGKGGEGKSRIGLVLRSLLGDSMNTGSLQKLETNRFARADQENKLLMVDDDLRMSALPNTDVLKSLVTLEDKFDIERKGEQSVQAILYVRFLCFGNGTLEALHDRSKGFYRRQIILTTKDKNENREDDPFLIDKLRVESEGIFLWALEGLRRLINNNYQFTTSIRAKQNLKEAEEKGNNMVSFMQSKGYFSIGPDCSSASRDLYGAYLSWCEDNLEKPFSQTTFSSYLKNNAKALGIIYDDKVMGNKRGFRNIQVTNFRPCTEPTPFDEK